MTSVIDYLKYQMFAQSIKRCFSNEVTVSILSERPLQQCRVTRKSQQTEIELKSLILAQIERWRHALHMQVER